MSNFVQFIFACALWGILPCVAYAAAPSLTLEEAVRRAVARDPQLQAEQDGVTAAKARVRQADVRPNPEIGVDVENFAGTGGQRSFAGAEVTLGLTQKIELGGKRETRVSVAERRVDVARLARAELERDIVVQTAAIYAAAAAAVRTQAALKDHIQDLERIVGMLKRRATSGAAPLADATRAEIDLARARADLDAARAEAETTKGRLALITGIALDGLVLPASVPADEGRTASYEVLEAGLAQHPRLARLTAAQRERTAQLAAETATAAPDVTVGVGVRRREGEDDTGFVVSAAMPLQVFDRNEGNIDAAKAELARSNAELDSGRRTLALEFQAAFADANAACDRTQRLSRDIVPAAGRILAETESGFSKGRSNALVLLDAVKAKASAQIDAAQAGVQCARARVNLMTLTGLQPATGKPAVWLSAQGDE